MPDLASTNGELKWVDREPRRQQIRTRVDATRGTLGSSGSWRRLTMCVLEAEGIQLKGSLRHRTRKYTRVHRGVSDLSSSARLAHQEVDAERLAAGTCWAGGRFPGVAR